MSSIYDYTVSSGASMVPQVSGASNLGSTSSYFDYLYVNHIVGGLSGTSTSSSGTSINGISGTVTISGAGTVTVLPPVGQLIIVSGTGDGTGDVHGPASSNDSAIAIYSGTSGKYIQNSSVKVFGTNVESNPITVGPGGAFSGSTNLSFINNQASLNSGAITTVYSDGFVNVNSLDNLSVSSTNANVSIAGSGVSITANASTTGVTITDGSTSAVFKHDSTFIQTQSAALSMTGPDVSLITNNSHNNIFMNQTSGINVHVNSSSGSINLITAASDSTIKIENNASSPTAIHMKTDGNVWISGNVVPFQSGTQNLGSASKHWGTIYVDNIVPAIVASGSGGGPGAPSTTTNRALTLWSGTSGQGLLNSQLVLDINQNIIYSGSFASGTQGFAGGGGVTVLGNNAMAFGTNPRAIGNSSTAFNNATKASGLNSFANGNGATAAGDNSHAEGLNTQTYGINSYAGGFLTVASGANSFTTGIQNKALGWATVVIGTSGTATGSGSMIFKDATPNSVVNSLDNSLLLSFTGGVTASPTTTFNASTISGTLISGITGSIATINASGVNISGNSVIVSGVSLGGGTSVFDSKLGNNLNIKSVAVKGALSLRDSGSLLTFSGIGTPNSAYVHFSGASGGITIYDSYNIKSAVRTNTGAYTFYFSSPFASGNSYGAIMGYSDRSGMTGVGAASTLAYPQAGTAPSGQGFSILTGGLTAITIYTAYDSTDCTVHWMGT